MLSFAFPMTPTPRTLLLEREDDFTMETRHNLDPSTVDGLQELCKYCRDSVEGYRTSAGHLKPGPLHDAFLQTAQKREQAVSELAQFLSASNENVPEDGTAKGAAHRWWIEAKTAITGNDEDAVLKEAIRGESYLENEFKEVLKDTAGSPANEVLQNQLSNVVACRKALEDIEARHN